MGIAFLSLISAGVLSHRSALIEAFTRQRVSAMSTNPRGDAARHLIPGAYDRTTLTYRQRGSMSGPAFGSADLPVALSSMDAATIAERELEGGGAVSERPRHVKRGPHGGPALVNEAHNEIRPSGGQWWFQLLHLARR